MADPLLTLPPTGSSSHLAWDQWRAHVRRFKVSLGVLALIGLTSAATVSLWPLLLVAPAFLALRAWRRSDERRIVAKYTPQPPIPSELEDWDTALRMRTGKPQADLERSMREIMADEATRRYIERQQGQ